MQEKVLIFKLLTISVVSLLLLPGCVPLLAAAGAGAAGGYYTGKHYNVKIKSPVKVEKKE